VTVRRSYRLGGWIFVLAVSAAAAACQDDPVGEPFYRTIYRVMNHRQGTIRVQEPPRIDEETVEAGGQLDLIDVGGFSNYPLTPAEVKLAILVTDAASGDTLFHRQPTGLPPVSLTLTGRGIGVSLRPGHSTGRR